MVLSFRSQEAISVFSSVNVTNVSYTSRFPFSFILKPKFEQLWKQVHDLQGIKIMKIQQQICRQAESFIILFNLIIVCLKGD